MNTSGSEAAGDVFSGETEVAEVDGEIDDADGDTHIGAVGETEVKEGE